MNFYPAYEDGGLPRGNYQGTGPTLFGTPIASGGPQEFTIYSGVTLSPIETCERSPESEMASKEGLRCELRAA